MRTFAVLFFSFLSVTLRAQVSFDSYFTDKVLRFDFMLADEYYSSEVAYEEFYPLKVEPWEPNITTMVDFDSKWKDMIAKGTPVPTPSEEKYKNATGLFEGGGYSAKGIFRPEMDCRMKSNSTKGYCSVCSEAVKKMIEFYVK